MIQGIANFQGVNHMFNQDCRLLLVFVDGQHSRLNSPCWLLVSWVRRPKMSGSCFALLGVLQGIKTSCSCGLENAPMNWDVRIVWM